MMNLKRYFVFLSYFSTMIFFETSVYALPAFSKKESVPCALCHNNGSAPHLTKTGYKYRRAGFRFPDNIGNLEADENALLMQTFSAGVNVDYAVVTQKDPNTKKERLTSNQFNLPALAIFPLVGGIKGNYGVFSEVHASQDGVELEMAELNFVYGSKDQFINIRTGYISPQGYGAGDQWIDDGNLPFIDMLTAQYNQDTLAMPFAAMGQSQYGAELGANIKDSHFTLGVYNGFDGSNGLANKEQSTLKPALMNAQSKKSKDFRLQLDQFFSDVAALTIAYYRGLITLLEPSNSVPWEDNYDTSRIYLTLSPLKNTLDIFLGQGFAKHHWVNSGSDAIAGSFRSQGSFLGANYYALSHLTLSGRADYFQYATTDFPASARGYALMASLPFENNIFVLHYNNMNSDLMGVTQDYRIEWRLFF